jgi:signal transduction histidine kinase
MDLKTMLNMLAVFQTAAALGMLVANRKQVSYRGFGLWTLAFFLMALGITLISQRGQITPFLSILVANAMILGAIAVFHQGTHLFFKLPGRSPLYFDALVMAATLIALLPLVPTPPGVALTSRTLAIASGMFLLCVHAGVRPLLHKRTSFGLWLHSIGLILLALYNLYRLVFALHADSGLYDEQLLWKSNMVWGATVTIMVLVGCLMLVNEVTLDKLQRRMAEIDDLNRNLETRVAEATALRIAQQDLLLRQSRQAAMGEMLGTIAHQWRQPLSTIGLIVQSLRKAFDNQRLDAAFMAKADADARRQIEIMSDTIDTFRAFLKPDKQKIAFSPARVAREAIAFQERQLAASHIQVQMDITAEPPSVMGNPNEFKQALINLIVNAREAIKTRAASGWSGVGRIEVTLTSDHGRVILRVADNGGGFQPGHLPSLFDPYFTTKEAQGGTGLGLYISRLIIEDGMNGRIEARNEADGALFLIELAESPHG